MEWRIADNTCWICGGNQELTEHHTLPKHWKPKNNVVVPICRKCHDKLNADDLAGLRSFSFKIEQELGRQLGIWGAMRLGIDRYVQSQDQIFSAFNLKQETKKEDKNGKTE